MKKTTFNARTAAEAYMALLRYRGVERVFTNAGTDYASIVEGYARADESGLEYPEVLVCPHENLAVSMAHGVYLVTGEPQAVMLHTSVGTANSACGILNAARDRAPIFLSAGRTPLYERDAFGQRSGLIHWAQELFDQAGMLRELVKWDYELRDASQVEDVIDRATVVAMSDPRGPTYVTLPREVLAQGIDSFTINENGPAVPSVPYPDPDAMDELVSALASAEFPIIVTAVSGLDRTTVPLLGELAERFAIGIVERSQRQVNVAPDHPLHLGTQIGPSLREADVIVCLDVDVPWTPGIEQPRDDALIVQCGVDPLFARYPMRSHRADLTITGSTRAILLSLAEHLEGTASPNRDERYRRIAARGVERREQLKRKIDAELDRAGPITKLFMNWALAQARPADAIVVNEYWVQAEVLAASEPGTFIDTPPSGGLGWGLPAAMGVQLASRDTPVVAAVGDGSYIFANPAACHQTMAAYDLPVLTIIANNARWNAVEASAIGMYPEGYASRAPAISPFAQLSPAPSYEAYVDASGGHGEVVSERSELVPALRRAFDIITGERRPVVLNVICAD
jgi:acetolactate synthase I/II/III large subunit